VVMDLLAPAPRRVVRTLPEYKTSATSQSEPLFRASSNENNSAPSEQVIRAVLGAARTGNRYPAPYGGELIDAIAAHLNIDATSVAVDGGSHALLNHLLLAFVGPASRVVFPWRSFEAYPISVAATGGVPVPVPNRPDGAHDLAAMIEQVDGNTAVVILCNPNNPTGSAFTENDLLDFLERVPPETLVVLDEAYIDFLDTDRVGNYDSVSLQHDHPNILILRTFSKCYALAGFRVGYAVAHPDVISSIRAVLPTFPVSQTAVAAAKAALADVAGSARTVAAVSLQRQEVTAALRAAGYPVFESHANFIWLPLGIGSSDFAKKCLQAGIIVRPFGEEGVRITVGQAGLAEALVHAVGVNR
jgi:histidinol-phosphate aminotransferase